MSNIAASLSSQSSKLFAAAWTTGVPRKAALVVVT